ncbi:MAG: hypothetical protein Phog2KO_27270 [Phototrophicaceae bacterium]
MSDNNSISFGDNANLTGTNLNTSGSQTNNGNVTINMAGIENSLQRVLDGNAKEKQQLQDLIGQLSQALQDIPAEQEKGAQKVAKRVEELVSELEEEEIDSEAVVSKGNLLKKAAADIQDVLPVVVSIATQIISHVITLAH